VPFGESLVQYIDLTQENTYLRGFTGGFADSNFEYMYLVPGYTGIGSTAEQHGISNYERRGSHAVRVSLTDFSSSGVSYFDLRDAGDTLVQFAGGFVSGGHVYYIPSVAGVLTRVSTADFSSSGVETLDLASINAVFNENFCGGFVAGGHAWLYQCYVNVAGGAAWILRLTLSDFSSSGVQACDIAGSVNANLKGWSGGFSDGTYAYFIATNRAPGTESGYITRISLSDFSTDGTGVSFWNLEAVDTDMVGFRSGFHDGTFAYLTGYYHGGYANHVVRFPLAEFGSASAVVTLINLNDALDGGAQFQGLNGGFFDGSAVYIAPHAPNTGQGTRVARIPVSDFSASSVSILNLADTNSALNGFHNAFYANGYGYFVPWTYPPHGNLVRIHVSTYTPSASEVGFSTLG